MEIKNFDKPAVHEFFNVVVLFNRMDQTGRIIDYNRFCSENHFCNNLTWKFLWQSIVKFAHNWKNNASINTIKITSDLFAYFMRVKEKKKAKRVLLMFGKVEVLTENIMYLYFSVRWWSTRSKLSSSKYLCKHHLPWKPHIRKIFLLYFFHILDFTRF